jgi:hypothetical protein
VSVGGGEQVVAVADGRGHPTVRAGPTPGAQQREDYTRTPADQIDVRRRNVRDFPENVEPVGSQALVARAGPHFECRDADARQSVEETDPAESASRRNGMARGTEGGLCEIVALESDSH